MLEPRAALDERQRAQILAIERDDVVGAQMRGIIRDEFRRHRLAVEALLQGREALHPPLPHHQQFTVEREIVRRYRAERIGEIGEGGRHLLAGARIEAQQAMAVLVASRRDLQADAVPFPFRAEFARIEAGEILFIERLRQHGRAKGRGVDRARPLALAFQPGEELEIGRREPVPDLFDRIDLDAAEIGDRGARETRGDADAQARR